MRITECGLYSKERREYEGCEKNTHMLLLSDCTWLHAPLFRCGISPPQASTFCCCNLPMPSSCRIAVVGDVHDDWSFEEDTKALQLLKVYYLAITSLCDQFIVCFNLCVLSGFLLVISVSGKCSRILCCSQAGDFGNENVELVKSISNVDFAKAVILGNHDAWNTQKFSAREKDAVQLQLECLGDEHVGYRRMDFSNLKLSVVGGRPFSCGGPQVFRKKLLTARYGIHDMDGSAERIYQAAVGTPADHSVIFLAHNGPTGLGSNMDDICGKDWIPGGGDFGDPDLAHAISQLKETTKLSIKLVAFGHMHKQLTSGNGLRKMIVVEDDNIVYLNGAIVPRVKTISSNEQGVASGTLRAFTVADISNGNLEKITETWVSVIGDDIRVEEELVLFSKGARL
ncbi:uncharacterized protein LOC125194182 isoform X2 [Salvia hispanica]|uniref:uncharacterized protein LOC125194182 isoform X2 n=1 Tax=Salvia hispanica TaxID=49212 RepID=UPI0020098A8B|nr:uncharacterized protein LOC125194182 isoform X2 [Salvia hispanica]